MVMGTGVHGQRARDAKVFIKSNGNVLVSYCGLQNLKESDNFSGDPVLNTSAVYLSLQG